MFFILNSVNVALFSPTMIALFSSSEPVEIAPLSSVAFSPLPLSVTHAFRWMGAVTV